MFFFFFNDLRWQYGFNYFCSKCLQAIVIRSGCYKCKQTPLQYSVKCPCCVPDSERQDQPEDQGEVLVSSRKHFQGFDCQQVQLEPQPVQQRLGPHQPHDTQGKAKAAPRYPGIYTCVCYFESTCSETSLLFSFPPFIYFHIHLFVL